MKLLGKLLLNCYDSYKKVMDHNQNPLRHIPDPVSRFWIMTVLAWMWCIAFGLYFSNVILMGVSFIGHLAYLYLKAILFMVIAIYGGDIVVGMPEWKRQVSETDSNGEYQFFGTAISRYCKCFLRC